MQVKVTLDQEIYKYLKTNAQQNRRTLSAELNMILEQHIKEAGMFNYPSHSPAPIPKMPNELEPPYKVTLKTPTKVNSIKTKINEEDLLNDPLYDPDF